MSENNRIEPGLGSVPHHEGGAHLPNSGHADSDSREDEINLLDFIVVIAENLRLLIFGPLLAGLTALGISFLITPTFTARTSFFPPQQQQSASAAMMAQLGAFAGFAASAAGIKNPADKYVALLKSTSVADSLIEQFRLIELYEADYRQAARENLANNTRISAGKDGLVVVAVNDVSPQRAADIANAYVTELESLLGRLALTEAAQRRVFFEEQLAQSKMRLAEAERKLAATGVSTRAIKANPEAAVAAVARVQAQVTAQEVKLAAMRGYLTDSAPELVQAQNELRALRSQLRVLQLNEPTVSQQGGYIDRFRDFKYEETLFELFARQFELAKVDEAKQGALVQVVDSAVPPERKSRPRRGVIAVFTTLGTGLILLIWAFVRRAIENSAAQPDGADKLASVRDAFFGLFLFNKKR